MTILPRPGLRQRKSGVAYHYTTTYRLQGILGDGCIKPGIDNLVWFSSNPHFENASRKWWTFGKRRFFLSREDQRDLVGAVRLVVDCSKLIQYPRVAELALMPEKDIRNLERLDHSLGANPRDWWGTLNPVLMQDVKQIEFLDDAGKWVELVPQHFFDDDWVQEYDYRLWLLKIKLLRQGRAA